MTALHPEDMSIDHWTVRRDDGITYYFHDEREIASANRIARMHGRDELPEAIPPHGEVIGQGW